LAVGRRRGGPGSTMSRKPLPAVRYSRRRGRRRYIRGVAGQAARHPRSAAPWRLSDASLRPGAHPHAGHGHPEPHAKHPTPRRHHKHHAATAASHHRRRSTATRWAAGRAGAADGPAAPPPPSSCRSRLRRPRSPREPTGRCGGRVRARTPGRRRGSRRSRWRRWCAARPAAGRRPAA
jgi:hypothetical protein